MAGQPEPPEGSAERQIRPFNLLRHGCLQGVVLDTLLADYLHDAAGKHGLDVMAQREFGFQPTLFSDLVGKKQTFADVPLESASLYCGMDVHLTRRLACSCKASSRPWAWRCCHCWSSGTALEPVLAEMEATGIRIDVPYLSELSSEMGMTLERLEQEARDAAGVDFNLASQNNWDLLFDTRPDRKKSRAQDRLQHRRDGSGEAATGPPSGAAGARTSGAEQTQAPTSTLCLSSWRQKRSSAHGFQSSRHSNGRLSSSNPNLQNIPVRTEYSRRIRKAFLHWGWTLLSADYSQIELRILTHLSGERFFKEAYRSGVTSTPSQHDCCWTKKTSAQTNDDWADDQLRRDLRDGCPALRQKPV